MIRKKRMVWVWRTSFNVCTRMSDTKPGPFGSDTEMLWTPQEWSHVFRSSEPPRHNDCYHVDVHDLVDGNIEWC